jgi:hypothetical protein
MNRHKSKGEDRPSTAQETVHHRQGTTSPGEFQITQIQWILGDFGENIYHLLSPSRHSRRVCSGNPVGRWAGFRPKACRNDEKALPVIPFWKITLESVYRWFGLIIGQSPIWLHKIIQ